jgi:hypothetical protein
LQVAERARIAAEEAVLSRKRDLAALLAERTAALAAEEEAWRAERELLEAAEASRAARDAELARLREHEAAAVEDALTAKRLESIANTQVTTGYLLRCLKELPLYPLCLNPMQESARAALATQRARRAAAAARQEEESARVAAARDAALRQRMRDEALLTLELQAEERVRTLAEQRAAEDGAADDAAGAERRAKAQLLEDVLQVRADRAFMRSTMSSCVSNYAAWFCSRCRQGESWRVEDEQRRVRRAMEAEAAEKVPCVVSPTPPDTCASETSRQALLWDLILYRCHPHSPAARRGAHCGARACRGRSRSLSCAHGA